MEKEPTERMNEGEKAEGHSPGLPSGPQVSEAERLLVELEEAQRERTQFKGLLQRVQADFANYRRRMEEEREEMRQRASRDVVLALLPALDDLERALGHTPQELAAKEPDWVEGVRLVQRKLLAVLEQVGVQPIEALGQEFDPWEHEAVSYQESASHRAGQVMAVVSRGYRLHGRVLRPAQVVVAKAPASQPAKAAGQDVALDGNSNH